MPPPRMWWLRRKTCQSSRRRCGKSDKYNIDGSNYFKLRDLGDALGFTVDYDADSNTAIVLSKGSTAVYCLDNDSQV